MRAAAIFDLDRTLLRTASGPVFAQVMRDLGIVKSKLPAEGLMFGFFNLFGESLPSIMMARQAVLVASGRPVGTFDEAAKVAAETLFAEIGPFARLLIDEHRSAGRKVIMATTTPYHLVAPLAELLGCDDVVATKYAVGEDGRYNGRLDGHFVWSSGKLAAVTEWAKANGISMEESYAYSDSIYDLPLLAGVGHPNAVNPDPRLQLYATAKRWPIIHFDVSPGVFKLPILDVELQRIAHLVARPEVFPYARFDVSGIENVPTQGPAILVGNHRSYFDMFAMSVAMREIGRTARFLAKKELFDAPVVGTLFGAIGGISVDRDHGGGDSFDNAALALAGGEIVGILPQGTIPRGEEFFETTLTGRTGAARLAAMTKAPVIPFGIWGSEQVWPRASRLPDVSNVRRPPLVSVRFGEPIDLSFDDARGDTERIMTAIAALLPEEAREKHEPTEDELRSTYPGGRLPGEKQRPAAADGSGRKRRAAKAVAKAVVTTAVKVPVAVAKPVIGAGRSTSSKPKPVSTGQAAEVKRAAAQSTAKKTTAKKTTAKKAAPAKTSAAKATPAKKSVAKTSAAKATPAKKSAATKSVAQKAAPKTAAAKKSTAKTSAAKKTTAKKAAPAKKSAATKSVAQKAAPKKTAADVLAQAAKRSTTARRTSGLLDS